eukprot:scaffold40265_cov39-Tisochrysis_lutea.AAC.6
MPWRIGATFLTHVPNPNPTHRSAHGSQPRRPNTKERRGDEGRRLAYLPIAYCYCLHPGTSTAHGNGPRGAWVRARERVT